MEHQIIAETYNFAHHTSEVATPDYLIHSHDCYELYYFVLSRKREELYERIEQRVDRMMADGLFNCSVILC